MDLFKIIGGVLVLLGFVFRGVSVAYFGQRAKSVPDTAMAQRKFAARKQRALIIDGLFIAAGFYVLLTK